MQVDWVNLKVFWNEMENETETFQIQIILE